MQPWQQLLQTKLVLFSTSMTPVSITEVQVALLTMQTMFMLQAYLLSGRRYRELVLNGHQLPSLFYQQNKPCAVSGHDGVDLHLQHGVWTCLPFFSLIFPSCSCDVQVKRKSPVPKQMQTSKQQYVVATASNVGHMRGMWPSAFSTASIAWLSCQHIPASNVLSELEMKHCL